MCKGGRVWGRSQEGKHFTFLYVVARAGRGTLVPLHPRVHVGLASLSPDKRTCSIKLSPLRGVPGS